MSVPKTRVNRVRRRRRAAPRKPTRDEAMRAVHSAGPGYAIPWGRMFLSATFQGVDWFNLTKSAIGPEMANLVHAALKGIGEKIDEVVIAEAHEAARHAATPSEAPTDAAPSAHAPESSEVASTEDTQEHHDSGPAVEPPPVVDVEALKAAEALGVKVDATQDEIRAALRRGLGSSGLHPDHGGDGEEAKRLIAAKNLLIERARAAVKP